MKLIKPILKQQRQKLANNAAERWKDNYFTGNKWFEFYTRHDKSSEQIWFALLSLGRTPDPDKVDAIIGNNSWTHNDALETSCISCGNKIEHGVKLSSDSNICIICLEEANKLCN